MKIISAVLAASLMMISGTQAWTPRNLTIVDSVSLFAGLMNGIVQEDNLDYLIGCVNGTENLVESYERMIYHFSWPTPTNIIKGIEDLRRIVLEEMPPAVVNCVQTPYDFVKLYNFFAILGNSTLLTQRVTYNFIWHYSKIMGHLNKASLYWDQGDFFMCGTELGFAVVDAIGDHKSKKIPVPFFESKKQYPDNTKKNVRDYLASN